DHVPFLLGDAHWIRGIAGSIPRPRYGIRVDDHADINCSLAWRRWLGNLRLSHKRCSPLPDADQERIQAAETRATAPSFSGIERSLRHLCTHVYFYIQTCR